MAITRPPGPLNQLLSQLPETWDSIDGEISNSTDSTRTRFSAASDLPVLFRKMITVATAADPSTLGDLLNWYKADSLALDHGDSVTSWGNSGSGSAATPPGTAPIYIANAVNGKPAVRFTGGAYLSFTARTNVRTVYVVVRYNYENLSNPIPSLAIGHGTVADWVGNQGTRVFAPSGSVGANITGGTAYYNGTQYAVALISKSPDFGAYSVVTSGNTSVSRIGSDRETYFFEGDVAEIILCSTAHNTATRQSIEAYLIGKYARKMPLLLVGDGDSISSDQPLFGDGVGDAQAAWIIQTVANLEPALGSFDVINCSLGGQKWVDLIGDDTTEVDPLISGTERPRCVVAAMCGTNDLLTSTALATMQSQATEYYSGRQDAGALVVAVTIPSCDTNEATRLSYNQWLRDNWTDFADALADPGADARMVDTTDTAYFDVDEIHLTSAGLAVLAEYIGPAILSALSVSEPAGIEFVDPNSYEPSIWIRTSTFIGFADNDPVASPPNSAVTGSVALTQGTSANRALYKTNLLNSKPGLRFDGSNDSYNIDSAEYRTIFIVAKYAPGTTFADFNGLIDLSGNRHLLNGVSGTSKLAAGTSGMLAAYKNGTELAFSSGYDFAPINTYWIGSFILSTKQTGVGTLGIVTGGAGRIWNGDILEVIAYPQKLGDDQRRNIEGYLGFEYGISTGSSYTPSAESGLIRLFTGPSGIQITVDGNDFIAIDPDGTVTLATPLVLEAGISGDLVWGGTAWESWTPTWTNLSVGNGTVVAKFKRLGKVVIARLSLIFGSTTSVSGGVSFSLPVTSTSYAGAASGTTLGACRLIDTSAPLGLDGSILNASTTTALITVLDTSGTYAKATVLSSSVPFTWAVSDELLAQFCYEAA
jgi:hypothetical protein